MWTKGGNCPRDWLNRQRERDRERAREREILLSNYATISHKRPPFSVCLFKVKKNNKLNNWKFSQLFHNEKLMFELFLLITELYFIILFCNQHSPFCTYNCPIREYLESYKLV